jgi:small subunit ribosomal protein S2
MTDLPNFTMAQLMDAGVHFGHKTMRWNPKMSPYIFGIRDGIHIIDLQQTVPMLHSALQVIFNVVKANGRVLFVGTKRQASEGIAEAAKRCGQYYVNHRWLGGMLTNWGTISQSIKAMCDLEAYLQTEEALHKLTKKERLELSRKYEKLERSLGGIRNMGGKPDLLFIIDSNKESLAILEAVKLNIPVISIVDSNCDPDLINYPVPGNDDSSKSIKLYCKLVSDTVLAGIQSALIASGADLGESEDGLIAAINDKDDDQKTTKLAASKKPSTTKVLNKKPRVSNKATTPKATEATHTETNLEQKTEE